jgi:hypothetical protein
MAVNRKAIDASAESVFRVLGNGWLFPVWVVGASRMRAVDGSWPSVGSKIHHSVGAWPALIDDYTELLEWDPPRRCVMRARLWPIGEARVELDVEPAEGGCAVTMTETPTSGPFAMAPRPVVDASVRLRNVETLNRLGYLAEGNAD